MLISPLSTPRLTLRPLERHDVGDAYVSWLNDKEINRFLELRFEVQTAPHVVEYIANLNDNPNELMLGIFLKAGDHIGNIKLGPIDLHHRRGTIGLMLGDKARWGQGYASEAIRAVGDFALDDLDLESVWAGSYSGNLGSIRAFLKAGFVEVTRLPKYWRADDGWHDEVWLMKRKDVGSPRS